MMKLLNWVFNLKLAKMKYKKLNLLGMPLPLVDIPPLRMDLVSKREPRTLRAKRSSTSQRIRGWHLWLIACILLMRRKTMLTYILMSRMFLIILIMILVMIILLFQSIILVSLLLAQCMLLLEICPRDNHANDVHSQSRWLAHVLVDDYISQVMDMEMLN
jgi:hypothetical protein